MLQKYSFRGSKSFCDVCWGLLCKEKDILSGRSKFFPFRRPLFAKGLIGKETFVKIAENLPDTFILLNTDISHCIMTYTQHVKCQVVQSKRFERRQKISLEEWIHLAYFWLVLIFFF